MAIPCRSCILDDRFRPRHRCARQFHENNALCSPDRAFVVITRYQCLLDHIRPDVVHVLQGRIVKTGGPDLALELEAKATPTSPTKREEATMTIATVPQRRSGLRQTDLDQVFEAMVSALAGDIAPRAGASRASPPRACSHRRVVRLITTDLRPLMVKVPLPAPRPHAKIKASAGRLPLRRRGARAVFVDGWFMGDPPISGLGEA